jgi:hypothetical protein
MTESTLTLWNGAVSEDFYRYNSMFLAAMNEITGVGAPSGAYDEYVKAYPPTDDCEDEA